MFVDVIAGGSSPSSWIDIHSVPEDLIIGVVTTFIGLLILFSIKPRLEVELKSRLTKNEAATATAGGSGGQPSPTLGFTVTNKGVRKVLEVQARLFRIDRTETFERYKICLDVNELFEIRGRLSPPKPYMALTGSEQQLGGGAPSPSLATFRWLARSYLARLRPSRRADSEKNVAEYWQRRKKDKRTKRDFTFWAKEEVVDHVSNLKEADVKLREADVKLKESDYILFQVIAKDGFTGFTRLKTKRFYKRELDEKIAQARPEAGGPSTPAQPPSLTVL